MPKLYLLGGESVYFRSAKEINLQAFQDAAEMPLVLVFAWARPAFDNTYRRRKIVSDYFRSLGAASVEYVEYGEAGNLEEKISSADLVYLTGGQASILLERIRNMHLEVVLRNFSGVIVGRSAGALALCRSCVTTFRYSHKVRVVKGLDIAPITIKAHYITEDDETLMQFSHKQPIYAVPKDSALIYREGKLSATGIVYLFNGGERYVFTEATL
jgi:dipeptidase E